MPYYFNNIMFPYPNMQQLNLDWIMQRVGETPQTVQLPALPTGAYTFSDLGTLIDDNTDLIPVGFSILLFGNPLTDETVLCGSALIWKNAPNNAFFYFFGREKLWFAYRFANTPWLKFGVTLTPLT